MPKASVRTTSANLSAHVELKLLAAGDRIRIGDQFRVRQADADSPEGQEDEGLDVLGRFAGVLRAQLCVELVEPRGGLSEDRLPAADIHVEHHRPSIAWRSAEPLRHGKAGQWAVGPVGLEPTTYGLK